MMNDDDLILSKISTILLFEIRMYLSVCDRQWGVIKIISIVV